jgi:hypothetical protein
MVLQRVRRWWWRQRGEEVLLVTFWTRAYPRDREYQVGRTRYRITRYMPTADPRAFEVWGIRQPGGHPPHR